MMASSVEFRLIDLREMNNKDSEDLRSEVVSGLTASISHRIGGQPDQDITWTKSIPMSEFTLHIITSLADN